jgi:hypothetical protein
MGPTRAGKARRAEPGHHQSCRTRLRRRADAGQLAGHRERAWTKHTPGTDGRRAAAAHRRGAPGDPGTGAPPGSGGWLGRTFELATRPADPVRSADVGLRDDRRRLLVLVECWNTIGDVGAAARSSERKRAEAERLAVAIGPLREDATLESYRVRGCWVVRATARNRALVARYPEVFATRFPGSSAGWVRALTAASEPPEQPGLVWCDVAPTRVFAWRRHG